MTGVQTFRLSLVDERTFKDTKLQAGDCVYYDKVSCTFEFFRTGDGNVSGMFRLLRNGDRGFYIPGPIKRSAFTDRQVSGIIGIISATNNLSWYEKEFGGHIIYVFC